MDEIMDYYKRLVPFLGTALGEHCEVALLDCMDRSLWLWHSASFQVFFRNPTQIYNFFI